MVFEEKTLSTERIFEGKVVNLRVDRVTVQQGESFREIVEHGGGSVIAAVKDDGRMIMVKQYRKAAQRIVLEVPAGKIDPGETPLAAAVRELKEETGYTARNIVPLTKMYPSVGYSQEQLYLYLATGLTAGETDFDENEAIEIEEYPVDQLYQMVMEGQIEDGKSQVAILMTKARFSEGQLPECWTWQED